MTENNNISKKIKSTEFGKFLTEFMKKNSYDLKNIALTLGRPISSISSYKNGGRVPKDDFIKLFLETYDFDRKTREDILDKITLDRTSELLKKNIKKKKIENLENLKDNAILFFENVSAAAGYGKLNFDESVSPYNPFEYYSQKGFIACNVEGDSMEPDIKDGDVVILDPTQSTPLNNRIFVIEKDGDIFLKELIDAGNYFILHSRNGTYKPMQVKKENVRILGKVVAVHREY